MAWTAQYIINDSAAAPQTWNRVQLGIDYAKYVNDTARAAGREEFFEFRVSYPSTTVNGVSVKRRRWNVKFSSRIVASETVPITSSWTTDGPTSLLDAVTAARTRLKDLNTVQVALGNNDTKIDDINGGRVQ